MIKKTRLIKLTQKVIQFNSENPPGREGPLADFIAKKMSSWGLEVKTYTFEKNRPNVIATLKGTSPNAKRKAILITPHIDTVPAGQGWRNKPFGGEVKNRRIYGRGATDDKGNLACAMEAINALLEDNVKFNYDIVFAATVDEETGSKKGIIPLLEKGILKPEAALILDADEFYTIVAQKGLIHGRIQVFGKKAHGAYNWQGINAIEHAAKIIATIKRHRFAYQKHSLLRGPTVNIGTIHGGDKVNIVADFCELSFDLRFMPGMDPKAMIRKIHVLASQVTKNFKIIIDDLQQPYEISEQHPLVTIYQETCRAMKMPTTLKGSEGATVITFFQKKKIPAVATGYGSRNTAHATDEYAEVNKLYQGAQVLEQFLKAFDQR